MMQFVLNFYGKWGLLDVVKSENNEKLLPDWLRNIKISPRLIERGTH